jgi:hypothetical protein
VLDALVARVVIVRAGRADAGELACRDRDAEPQTTTARSAWPLRISSAAERAVSG